MIFVTTPAITHGQQTPSKQSVSSAGPRLELTATAMHRAAAQSATSTAVAAKKNVGQPVALMIVGGAAIVVGALIGGDVGTIFMVGGAVAGLIGLYQYLQ